MTTPLTEGQAGAAKAGGVWAAIGVGEYLNAIGVNGWGDAASIAAFVVSCLLIIDWFWKKFKPTKEKRDEADGE